MSDVYFLTCLSRHQAIDSFFTSDAYVLSGLEWFQTIMQDFQQSYNESQMTGVIEDFTSMGN